MLTRLTTPRRILVFSHGGLQARISTTSTPTLRPKINRPVLLPHTQSHSQKQSKMSTTSTEPATHYDAIIIGSGQGGGPLAQAYANAGKRTALIEKSHVGGTCINEGCTPTKTMIASARVARVACRAHTFGVQFKKSSLIFNMDTVRKRKREIVESFRSGGENRMKNIKGLDLIMGTARFTGPETIEVKLSDPSQGQGPLVITADQIFINTGCSPSKLDVKNIENIAGLLDSTSVMELDEVPRHVVVVGGGYVGIEFAQMLKRFGAKVSIVQRATKLLPREDPDISDEVRKILTDGGIDVYTGARVSDVGNVTLGQIVMSVVQSNGTIKSLLCSHVLAAAGRSPNTKALNLPAAGVETNPAGFINVDEHLRTTNPKIHALGDVKGGPQFTHVSYDDMRIVKHNLLTHANTGSLASIENRLVPYTVFMDPQLGRIGLTEEEARKQYPKRNLKVAKMPMAYVARALETDESLGFMKAVVDADSKEILGFACLGLEGGEIMSMVQLAMMGGMTYDELENAIFAHPCLSESLNNLWGFLE